MTEQSKKSAEVEKFVVTKFYKQFSRLPQSKDRVSIQFVYQSVDEYANEHNVHLHELLDKSNIEIKELKEENERLKKNPNIYTILKKIDFQSKCEGIELNIMRGVDAKQSMFSIVQKFYEELLNNKKQ